jgi:hypothetical protein
VYTSDYDSSWVYNWRCKGYVEQDGLVNNDDGSCEPSPVAKALQRRIGLEFLVNIESSI